MDPATQARTDLLTPVVVAQPTLALGDRAMRGPAVHETRDAAVSSMQGPEAQPTLALGDRAMRAPAVPNTQARVDQRTRAKVDLATPVAAVRATPAWAKQQRTVPTFADE